MRTGTMTTATLTPLPEYWNELNLSDKEAWVSSNTPFRYIFTPDGWSTGIWYGEEYGTISNGGDVFHCIADALERFEGSWERILAMGA